MIIHSAYTHGGDIYRKHIVLDFSVNVNPLGTPEPVKEAVRAAAEDLSAYPDPYCEALRRRLSEIHGVPMDWLLCGNGAAELIYQFISALRPQKTLLPVPSFSDDEAALAAAGCTPLYYPLLREEGFAVTEKLLAKITDDTELLMLTSPNNPTGRVVSRDLLMRILERCRKTRTWLFLDECFGELTDEATPSLAAELRPDDRVFLLRAFTKTYAMAGVRLGYAVCPNREMTDRITGSAQPWNVSTPAQAAGLAALGCMEWAEKARALIRSEKEYLYRELRELGVYVLQSDANYLLLSGVPGLYDGLLARGILIRNCENYLGLGPGDARIAVRTHEDNVTLVGAVREVLHA